MREVAGPGVFERHSSRGAAFRDFDNDGDVDVLVKNRGEPPSLLRNDLAGGSHWVSLRLEGTRFESPRDARHGDAAGRVTGTDGVVLSAASYLSRNDRRLHFGSRGRQLRRVYRALACRFDGDRIIRFTEGSSPSPRARRDARPAGGPQPEAGRRVQEPMLNTRVP